jgi:hypothetical protein
MSTAEATEKFIHIMTDGFIKQTSKTWVFVMGGSLFSDKHLRQLFEALEREYFGECNIQFQEETREERSTWLGFHFLVVHCAS